jgi:hypothetical protein
LSSLKRWDVERLDYLGMVGLESSEEVEFSDGGSTAGEGFGGGAVTLIYGQTLVTIHSLMILNSIITYISILNILAMQSLVFSKSVSILDFLAGEGFSEGPGLLRSGPMCLAKLSIVAAAVAVEEQKESNIANEAGKDGNDSEASKVEGNLRKSGVDCSKFFIISELKKVWRLPCDEGINGEKTVVF